MSWIDIFLADGDPHKVYGADAKTALSHMMRIRDLPSLIVGYRAAKLPLHLIPLFLTLDFLRAISYRKGFKDGAKFPWPEDP
jgi:hypothetical protein